WSARVDELPRSRPLRRRARAGGQGPAIRPWVGVGRVHEADPKGEWVDVELPGRFENGRRVVRARLSTPYSGAGPSGTAGINLVPERQTDVALAWSGRFDEPIICLGNLRVTAAALASPSISLSRGATLLLDTLHFGAVGPVRVD